MKKRLVFDKIPHTDKTNELINEHMLKKMLINYTLHPHFPKLLKLIIPCSGQNIFQPYSVTDLKRTGEFQHSAFSCCTWNAEKIFYYYLYLPKLAVLATPGLRSTQVCLMSLLWNNQSVLWEINWLVPHLNFFCYLCLRYRRRNVHITTSHVLC